MSCVLKHDPCRFLQSLHIAFSCRPVDHACLTETTAADTASLDLQGDTILSRLDMRNNRCFQFVVIFVHIDNELFFHLLRHAFVFRSKRLNRTVFFVGNFIERRHIDSRDLCCFQKKILSAAAILLVGLICIKQSIIDSLSLSNIKEIKELCQRFRIVGTCAAADHQRIILGTLCCLKRDSAKIQKLENVCITHLITQCDPEEIKFLHRILGLQSKQRNFFLSHDLIKICPRRKETLAPYVVSFIEHIV